VVAEGRNLFFRGREGFRKLALAPLGERVARGGVFISRRGTGEGAGGADVVPRRESHAWV